MTSVRGRGRPRRERHSVAPSVAPSIAPLDSSLPLKSGDELSDQPARPSEGKPLSNSPPAANSVLKYSEDDLQRTLKADLGAQAPVPTLAPVPAPAPVLAQAPIVAEAYWEKLKARSLDLYRGNSHMDCYNFCQQCQDYFATAGATEPTRILFTASFLRDRISFRLQKYKRRYDAETPVPVT